MLQVQGLTVLGHERRALHDRGTVALFGQPLYQPFTPNMASTIASTIASPTDGAGALTEELPNQLRSFLRFFFPSRQCDFCAKKASDLREIYRRAQKKAGTPLRVRPSYPLGCVLRGGKGRKTRRQQHGSVVGTTGAAWPVG